MSRTYKDRPTHIRFPEPSSDERYERVPYLADALRYRDKRRNIAVWDTTQTKQKFFLVERPGIKPKRRRAVDTEWHWLGSTPSSWTRLMMNRPMRARGRAWEAKVLREYDLEETDPPGVSHKPHQYYW